MATDRGNNRAKDHMVVDGQNSLPAIDCMKANVYNLNVAGAPGCSHHTA